LPARALWYNVEKGFGIVAADRGGKDVFVHATTLSRSGLGELSEGQRVRMQIGQGQKGPEARSIELSHVLLHLLTAAIGTNAMCGHVRFSAAIGG
jgi:cold shock CspA family protein